MSLDAGARLGTYEIEMLTGKRAFAAEDVSDTLSIPNEVFTPGSATELFSGYVADLPGPTYDMHPDGERFLLIENVAVGDHTLTLVHNWLEELKRLVPTED